MQRRTVLCGALALACLVVIYAKARRRHTEPVVEAACAGAAAVARWEPGTLVFGAGHTLDVRVVQWYEACPWAHVAVVLCQTPWGPLLWEANNNRHRNITDRQRGHAVDGVQTVLFWELWDSGKYRDVAFREPPCDIYIKTLRRTLRRHVAASRRRTFERSLRTVASAAYGGVGAAPRRNPGASVFCSELVVEWLHSVGVAKHLEPAHTSPKALASEALRWGRLVRLHGLNHCV
jgi:hypothetical protein